MEVTLPLPAEAAAAAGMTAGHKETPYGSGAGGGKPGSVEEALISKGSHTQQMHGQQQQQQHQHQQQQQQEKQQRQQQRSVVKALPACLAAAVGTRLQAWLPGPGGLGAAGPSRTLPRHLVTQMAADQAITSALLQVKRVQGIECHGLGICGFGCWIRLHCINNARTRTYSWTPEPSFFQL